MKIPFTKMHAAGNDYIYINGFETYIDDPATLARTLSRHHFSVGSDGLVLILPADTGDARMQMFNADGSEGLMCGNAIRCVGKYLYDRGLMVPANGELDIETASGMKHLRMTVRDGAVETVQVDMGVVTVAEEDVVLTTPATPTVDEIAWRLRPVSVGNPHAVTFLRDLDRLDVAAVGARLSAPSAAFPDGANIEFAALLDSCVLRMRVCERGTGVTLACGTGACATAAAAVATGRCPAEEDILIHLDGGDITVRITADGHALMTGGATFAFDGVVEVREDLGSV